MSKLSAFFYYYGAKNALARRYPAPEYSTIIEPFAGSAAYALAYPHGGVMLYDLDERVCGVWDYLIRTPEREILALPDLPFEGHVDDLPVCQEARWLVGFWITHASASGPARRWQAWATRHNDETKYGGGAPTDFWSSRTREKLARQQRYIRHWHIHHAPWTDAPVMPATYFVDPPYQVAGKHYRHAFADFDALGAWCRASPGQVIACEAEGADWLPFCLLDEIACQRSVGAHKKKSGRSREVVWTNRDLTRGRQRQWLDLLAGTRADNDNDVRKAAAE